VLVRIEESDRSVQMLEAASDVAERGKVHPHPKMPFHLESGVVLLLGQVEELATDGCSFVELGPVEMEAGETPEHREQFGRPTPFL
jgi:hypothetical protein